MGDPSPALADISENVRAKIYCLMTRIGFNELPGIATEDYVTLALIEKYYDLKVRVRSLFYRFHQKLGQRSVIAVKSVFLPDFFEGTK